MDLIQNFMDRDGDSIIGELTSRGFSAEQAKGFLPEALATLMQSLKNAGFAELFASSSSAGLPDSVDIAALASRTGVDSAKVETGLNALIPRLMAFVKDRQGLSSLPGKKASGLTSVFKRLHH